MKPGTGVLDLGFKLTPAVARAEATYLHRLTPNMSAFAQGWGETNWRGSTDFGVVGGIRLRF